VCRAADGVVVCCTHELDWPICAVCLSVLCLQLMKLTGPFMLRRLKFDLLTELPDKMEMVSNNRTKLANI
jgi:hypothetical protein